MTIEQEQLLALLRIALHPQDDLPKVLFEKAIDWNAAFEESKRQSVIGIALQGFKVWLQTMENVPGVQLPERMLLIRWHGLSENIQKRNLLLNEQSLFVMKGFQKDGFRSCIMKGQGNAWLYGPELGPLRLSGDIDVWVEGGFKKVNDYVQSVCPTKDVNELEIHFNVMKKTEVEVHYRPCIMRNPFKNCRMQRFFLKHADACFTNKVVLDGCTEGTAITTLPFNLIHQLVHIHLHLFTEGIGLRQLMDYYFLLLRSVEQDCSIEEVKTVVKKLGLNRFAEALIWVLQYIFGLPTDCCIWQANETDGRFLLQEIMKTGNFGHHDKENKERKKKAGFSIWNIFIRNLKLSRFDRWDWFWGPIWRVYHGFWKKVHGFN